MQRETERGGIFTQTVLERFIEERTSKTRVKADEKKKAAGKTADKKEESSKEDGRYKRRKQ